MDLYNKLKADKSIDADDFVEMIQQLFEYTDESNFKNDADKMKLFMELANSQNFKRKVLMFWTGSRGILSEIYKVAIDPDLGKMPASHTCFNQIDLPTDDHIKSKQELYNSFTDIFMSGMDENFTNA
jgi:hypothetical protein